VSLYDYHFSQRDDLLVGPFYGIIMAAMPRADTDNLDLLKAAFPETWAELQARYWAPGGLLPGEHPAGEGGA